MKDMTATAETKFRIVVAEQNGMTAIAEVCVKSLKKNARSIKRAKKNADAGSAIAEYACRAGFPIMVESATVTGYAFHMLGVGVRSLIVKNSGAEKRTGVLMQGAKDGKPTGQDAQDTEQNAIRAKEPYAISVQFAFATHAIETYATRAKSRYATAVTAALKRKKWK